MSKAQSKALKVDLPQARIVILELLAHDLLLRVDLALGEIRRLEVAQLLLQLLARRRRHHPLLFEFLLRHRTSPVMWFAPRVEACSSDQRSYGGAHPHARASSSIRRRMASLSALCCPSRSAP